jgi:hypothetical protein
MFVIFWKGFKTLVCSCVYEDGTEVGKLCVIEGWLNKEINVPELFQHVHNKQKRTNSINYFKILEIEQKSRIVSCSYNLWWELPVFVLLFPVAYL